VLPSDLSEKLKAVGKDTTYLSVVDREGNIVSLIQSVYDEFGSGLVVPGAGFPLHDRGALFDFEPGRTNTVAPHKRPMTTLIPGFMEKGDVRIGFGIMGGFNQAQAHAQFVSDLVDFQFNIQAALEAPRFTKLNFEGCDVMIESPVPQAVRDELAKLGHQVRVLQPFAYAMGRGNAVMRDGQGVNYGASDPRGDGEAIPESPPAVRHP
jgi:gamma-glutamyltranspeptidase/glutathione hydrolase